MTTGEWSIRVAAPSDCEELSRMRSALWPESPAIGKPSSTLPYAVFVAEGANGELAGFLEVGLRSHADGCDPKQPVGFVEGWFVKEDYRRKGLGRQLLIAAEEWSRGHGCVEMASDTWIDSLLSQQVHESLDFEEVDRCVHYRKGL
jgi:aminoglycoside 6'-N-acetyltransferase I